MSKKYIITIKSEYEDTTRGIMVLGARDSNLFVDTVTLDDLEELNSDYINEHFGDLQDTAYQRGLEEGKRTAVGAAELREKLEYQKGFEDGKAQVERGCDGCKYAGKVVTGPPCITCCNSYKNQWTAKDDKIEVGDEVIYNGTTKCVVVTPETDEKYASLFDCNGNHYFADHRECKKTGRHFDIDKILEKMRHD